MRLWLKYSHKHAFSDVSAPTGLSMEYVKSLDSGHYCSQCRVDSRTLSFGVRISPRAARGLGDSRDAAQHHR